MSTSQKEGTPQSDTNAPKESAPALSEKNPFKKPRMDRRKRTRKVYKKKFDQRPPIIADSVKREICKRIVSGFSMAEINADPDLPTDKEIYDLVWRDKDFATQFRNARLARAAIWGEELYDLAKQAENIEGRGKEALAWVQAIRTRIETTKFLVSRLLPAEYGSQEAPDSGTKAIGGVLEIIREVTHMVRDKANRGQVLDAEVVEPKESLIPVVPLIEDTPKG